MGTNNSDMKVFALAAAASASTTEWMLNTWWEEAQNVFNFASNNYAQWNKAIATVPDSKFEPLWAFCNGNGGDDITGDELVACGKKAAEFAELPDAYSNYVYEFGAKYFNTNNLLDAGELKQWKQFVQSAMGSWKWEATCFPLP